MIVQFNLTCTQTLGYDSGARINLLDFQTGNKLGINVMIFGVTFEYR